MTIRKFVSPKPLSMNGWPPAKQVHNPGYVGPSIQTNVHPEVQGTTGSLPTI